MTRYVHHALSLFALAAIAVPAAAQAPTSFVATLGSDTVAVEHFARQGNHLTGQSVAAYPSATMRTYTITFGADGAVQRVHIETGLPGAPPTMTADYAYSSDSVAIEMNRDTVTRRFTVAYSGARPLPFYEDLFVFWDEAVSRALAAPGDSVTIGVLGGRGVMPIEVHRRGAAAADFGYSRWGTVHAQLDAAHRFTSLDMTATTSAYIVHRVPALDIARIAAAWAARPNPGILSPRDTARAAVAGARVMIDYGRPSARGRTIFPNVVRWGEVWRTGANAATQLITDRDLVIGGTTIPAGTYSLWSVASPSGWELVVNRQHGQWGTEHHPEQDFARVPLTMQTPAVPVERFTIAFRGDMLSFAWGDREGTVVWHVK